MTYNAVTLIAAVNKLAIPQDQYTFAKIQACFHILKLIKIIQRVSSVQFSRSVMSDFLRPHESQHARPPCP